MSDYRTRALLVPSSDQQNPGPTPDQRQSDEVVKFIRKLRWIGMEDEAKRMELQMLTLPPRAGER